MPEKIEEVQTLKFPRPVLPLADAVVKFQGKKTYKTLAAARRIAAAKHEIKIPRNLLRQLFRVTGGWKTEPVAGWDEEPNSSYKVITEGDLELIVKYRSSGSMYAGLLRYRGMKIASFRQYCWHSDHRVRTALETLGVDFVK